MGEWGGGQRGAGSRGGQPRAPAAFSPSHTHARTHARTTSRPRLPREMMMASAASTMERKLNSDWRDSHLAMIWVCVGGGRAGGWVGVCVWCVCVGGG